MSFALAQALLLDLSADNVPGAESAARVVVASTSNPIARIVVTDGAADFVGIYSKLVSAPTPAKLIGVISGATVKSFDVSLPKASVISLRRLSNGALNRGTLLIELFTQI